jgi:lysine biosynthesis protein LysW
MKNVKCPACGGKIKIYYDHEPGDEVSCEDCEKEFQIMSIKPVMLESFDPLDDGYCFGDDDLFYGDRYED